MIDLDILEFSLGVAESSGDKTTAIYCASLRELITRLREAEKDAARYRWLRDIARHEYDVDDFFGGSSDSVDGMIDKAMKEKGDE